MTTGRLLAASLVAAAGSLGASETLVPVPHPDFAAFEPAVAEQLESIAELVDEQLEAVSSQDPETLAESLDDVARLYHAYDILEAAMVAYEDVLRLDPDNYEAAHLLGIAAARQGEPERAEEAFGRALRIRPDAAASLVRRGQTRLTLGRSAEAGDDFSQALVVTPGLPAALAGLGEVALSERRYEEAVGYLEEALAAVPAADRLHHPLGLAYRGLGDLERAVAELEQAGGTGIRPPDPLVDALSRVVIGERVHLLRGRAAYRRGALEAAASEFAAAVTAQPQSVPALVGLGSALGGLGDLDGAIGQFERVLELEPEHEIALFDLGVLLRHAGRPDESAELLRRVVAKRFGDSGAHRELAASLRAAGRPLEALTHYERATGLDPYDEAAHLGRVTLLVDRGRFVEAVESLEQAHALLPRSGRIAVALARCLAAIPAVELRDGPRALDLAQRVFAAQPTADSAALVALALAQSGRCDEAAGWIERALLAELPTTQREALESERARYAAGPPCPPP